MTIEIIPTRVPTRGPDIQIRTAEATNDTGNIRLIATGDLEEKTKWTQIDTMKKGRLKTIITADHPAITSSPVISKTSSQLPIKGLTTKTK